MSLRNPTRIFYGIILIFKIDVKTLSLSITITVSAIILGTGLIHLSYGEEFNATMTIGSTILVHTLQPNYVPGDLIQVLGYSHPDYITYVELQNPEGTVENYTGVTDNHLGNFTTIIQVPQSATNGTWTIEAINGIDHTAVGIPVYSNSTGTNVIQTSNNTDVSVITLASYSTIQNVLPPLQQLKQGILAKDIVCNQGLQLVIKAEDGSPACIKQDSVSILLLRGWINSTDYLR